MKLRVALLALVVVAPWAPWTPGAEARSGYVIVKTDGSKIEAAGPFEIEEGRARFRLLSESGEETLMSLDVAEIDLPATEAANGGGAPAPDIVDVAQAPAGTPEPATASPPAATASPAPARPGATPTTVGPPKAPSGPVFGTKDISALLATDEMQAERERIKQLREQQKEEEYRRWQAAHAEPAAAAKPARPAVTSDEQELAKTGKIRRGMTAQGVVLAWGEADRRAQADGDGREVWTYFARGKSPFVVTLADGRVIQIQNEDRLLFVASLKDPAPVPKKSP